jgi:hypothetical protein
MKKILLNFTLLCLLGTENSFSSNFERPDWWENQKSDSKYCSSWKWCMDDYKGIEKEADKIQGSVQSISELIQNSKKAINEFKEGSKEKSEPYTSSYLFWKTPITEHLNKASQEITNLNYSLKNIGYHTKTIENYCTSNRKHYDSIVDYGVKLSDKSIKYQKDNDDLKYKLRRAEEDSERKLWSLNTKLEPVFRETSYWNGYGYVKSIQQTGYKVSTTFDEKLDMLLKERSALHDENSKMKVKVDSLAEQVQERDNLYKNIQQELLNTKTTLNEKCKRQSEEINSLKFFLQEKDKNLNDLNVKKDQQYKEFIENLEKKDREKLDVEQTLDEFKNKNLLLASKGDSLDARVKDQEKLMSKGVNDLDFYLQNMTKKNEQTINLLRQDYIEKLEKKENQHKSHIDSLNQKVTLLEKERAELLLNSKIKDFKEESSFNHFISKEKDQLLQDLEKANLRIKQLESNAIHLSGHNNQSEKLHISLLKQTLKKLKAPEEVRKKDFQNINEAFESLQDYLDD